MGKRYVFPLTLAVFGLLVTLKPFNEAKVKLKLIHALNPDDFGR
jgi:hypothetical protein